MAGKTKKGNITGQTINNWTALEEVETSSSGTRRFLCRCNRCGCLSIKSKGQVLRTVTGRCENCPPDYGFVVTGDTAEGILPDGTHFLINTEDISRVSELYWHYHKGYIISTHRGKPTKRLHRFILGIEEESVLVDHINRNPLDCRKENLRIVTEQQNSINRSLACNNTTGYVGVSFVKSRGLYRAQISLNSTDISLGRSKDPVTCAQMYNIASGLLFGEFRGHVNDVPDAGRELMRKIYMRCQPYMADAEVATQKCGHFLLEETA